MILIGVQLPLIIFIYGHEKTDIAWESPGDVGRWLVKSLQVIWYHESFLGRQYKTAGLAISFIRSGLA